MMFQSKVYLMEVEVLIPFPGRHYLEFLGMGSLLVEGINFVFTSKLRLVFG